METIASRVLISRLADRPGHGMEFRDDLASPYRIG